MSLKDILKTKNIIVSSPEDSLASTLLKLSTSHDASFVFGEDEALLGVVNPYVCLIKTSFPGNAKLQQCLFYPPKVDINYSLGKVAQLMSETKLHYLPVYQNRDDFKGIISARRLLSSLKDSSLFDLTVDQVIKQKSKIVTVYEDDFLTKAIALFKTSHVSKIIVLGRDQRLKGVLSYYDIISYLVSPAKREYDDGREGKKDNFYNQKVKNFAKSYVLTLPPTSNLKAALKLIIGKKIGSVIVVDKEKRPLGIVTTGDFLRILQREYKRHPLTSDHTSLSDLPRRMFNNIFSGFSHLLGLPMRVASLRHRRYLP